MIGSAATAELKLASGTAIAGRAIVLALTIANRSERTLEISTFEPTRAPPDRQWPWSLETYKVSVLISARILAIALCDAGGEPVASRALAPWVTPLLGRAAIAPGDSFSLRLRIDELFEIRTPGAYQVQIGFHDENVTAEAGLAFDIKPDGTADSMR